MTYRFAIITDAHIGPVPWYKDCNRLMAGESTRVLTSVVERINAEPSIDFVMQLGDLIQDNVKVPSREEDLDNLQRALTILKGLRAPLYHVTGNHCTANLTHADLQQAYGYDRLYYSFESGGYLHIVLFSEAPGHKDMFVSDAQLEWLSAELARSNRQALVYLHHQLVEHSLEKSFWFIGTPEKAFVKNAAAVRKIIESSGKVRAVFNGHMHQNNYLVSNGVPYFTIQSMVEDWHMVGRPCEAHCIVTVTPKSISVDVRGENPVSYIHAFTPAPSGRGKAGASFSDIAAS